MHALAADFDADDVTRSTLDAVTHRHDADVVGTTFTDQVQVSAIEQAHWCCVDQGVASVLAVTVDDLLLMTTIPNLVTIKDIPKH